MVLLKNILLCATTVFAAAAPLSARDADTDLILKDLKNLDDSVNALTATIKAYKSGILSATPILLGVTGVHLANRKANLDTVAIVQPQNVENSLKIVNFVNQTVVVDIPAGVEALKAKKAPLVAAGLSATVVSSLDLLQYDHRSFSANLKKKAASETYDYVDYVVKVIDDSITSGIQEFS